VVEQLTELAGDASEDSKVWTEIAYLQKHGEAGRLKYPTFKGLGLPLEAAPLRAISGASTAIRAAIYRTRNAEVTQSSPSGLTPSADAASRSYASSVDGSINRS